MHVGHVTEPWKGEESLVEESWLETAARCGAEKEKRVKADG